MHNAVIITLEGTKEIYTIRSRYFHYSVYVKNIVETVIKERYYTQTTKTVSLNETISIIEQRTKKLDQHYTYFPNAITYEEAWKNLRILIKEQNENPNNACRDMRDEWREV
jgi:hypothetical protein